MKMKSKFEIIFQKNLVGAFVGAFVGALVGALVGTLSVLDSTSLLTELDEEFR